MMMMKKMIMTITKKHFHLLSWLLFASLTVSLCVFAQLSSLLMVSETAVRCSDCQHYELLLPCRQSETKEVCWKWVQDTNKSESVKEQLRLRWHADKQNNEQANGNLHASLEGSNGNLHASLEVQRPPVMSHKALSLTSRSFFAFLAFSAAFKYACAF